ncbi:MAG: flagellar biosynthetic protein FliR, partial [Paludibacterium sp.]|uniref:flagellar biosynthetic protein FliR n=1 Tax=Paludibacterium sp. TaxID=1917523 RepID=UPI0025E13082
MGTLTVWLPLLFVAAMHPLGVMLLMPVFSNAMLGSALVRNALALMATLPVLPLMTTLQVPDPWQQPAVFAWLVASELAIGFLLGFSASVPFWAIDAAGYVLDTLRGASIAGVLNPLMSGAQSSPL